MKTRKPLTRMDLLNVMLSNLRHDIYQNQGKNEGKLTTKQTKQLCKYRRMTAALHKEDSKDI